MAATAVRPSEETDTSKVAALLGRLESMKRNQSHAAGADTLNRSVFE